MLAKQTVQGGVVVLLGLMVVLGGCSQPLNKREKGVLVGGGLGAASGAIIGATTSRNKVKGGVIGAAAGGILGGVIGNNVDVKKKKVP